MIKVAASQLIPIYLLWDREETHTPQEGWRECDLPRDAPMTAEVAALLINYSFELCGESASALIDRWVRDFGDSDWVRLAVIEALYQGRYKGISVEQILAFWHRRGRALCHFNLEFERIVCTQLPERNLMVMESTPMRSPLVFPASGSAGPSPGGRGPGPGPGPGEEYFYVHGGNPGDRAVTDTDADEATDASELPPLNLTELPDQSSQALTNGISPTMTTILSQSQPIRKFTPADSVFYTKLKAVAEPKQDS